MQPQKEKSLSINFNTFLSITKIDKLLNKFKSDPNPELTKKAQFFLDTNNYDSYVTMLSQGYIPNIEQKKLMNDFVNSILSGPLAREPIKGENETSRIHYEEYYNERHKKLERFLNNGLKLNYDNAVRFLHNNTTESYFSKGALYGNESFLTKPEYTLKSTYMEFPQLTKQLRDIISQSEFSDYFFSEFKKSLYKKNTKDKRDSRPMYIIYRHIEVLTYAPEILFRNINFEDLTVIIKKLSYPGIGSQNSQILNNIVNNLYKTDVKRIFTETKSAYPSKLVENLTLNNIRNEEHNMKELPKLALDLVISIEDLYKKIKQYKFEDTDKINTLNTLLEKRVPEVLSKYLKVDPEYRTTLKSSQGKNAEDLMIDSLNNIKDSFINVFEEINQNTVNSLSATNRYTKTLKM
jgi:hypothetical protein